MPTIREVYDKNILIDGVLSHVSSASVDPRLLGDMWRAIREAVEARCVWTVRDGIRYDTTCGTVQYEYDTPGAPGYEWCRNCGKAIERKESGQ